MGDGGLALGAAVLAAASAGDSVVLALDRLALGPLTTSRSSTPVRARPVLQPERAGNLPRQVADLLAEGRIVMWFQGAMEYGPARSVSEACWRVPDRFDIRDRLNLA
jgi:carbamoyltransferase